MSVFLVLTIKIPPPTSTLLTLKFTQSQLISFSNPYTISYKFFIMATYTPSLALQGALERIKNPPFVYHEKKEGVQTKYEHHVATWACTKLKEVFSNEEWAITPEQADLNTGNKPDLVVEKAILHSPGQTPSGPHMKLHLIMELKKVGVRKQDGLIQLCKALQFTLDTKGYTYPGEFEVFAVVQCGLQIGFFEFHSDQSNLDEEGIPHFQGCVSLTQDYEIKGKISAVMDNKPNDLEELYTNYDKLRKQTSERADAKEYHTPCFFHLEKHQQQVHNLFQYMEMNEPRSSW